MSAEPNFTETEYELLSAYLDGELADDERAALEQRLATDAALRAELNALRRTMELVKALPTLKAPRSFALTPEMIGQAQQPHPQPSIVELTEIPGTKRRRQTRVPLYALASAAALLVLVVGVLSLIDGSRSNDVIQGLDGQSGSAPEVAAGVTQPPTPTAFVPAPVQALPMATTAPDGVVLTATSLAQTFAPPAVDDQTAASAFMATQAPQLDADGGVDSADTANAALTATFASETQRSAGGAADATPAFTVPPPTATLISVPDETDQDQYDAAQEAAEPTESADEAETSIMLAQEASPTPQVSGTAGYAEAPSFQAEATQVEERPPVDTISAPPEGEGTTADTARQSVLQTPSPSPAAPDPSASEAAQATFLGIEPAFWLVLGIAALLLAVGLTLWFLGRRAR